MIEIEADTITVPVTIYLRPGKESDRAEELIGYLMDNGLPAPQFYPPALADASDGATLVVDVPYVKGFDEEVFSQMTGKYILADAKSLVGGMMFEFFEMGPDDAAEGE